MTKEELKKEIKEYKEYITRVSIDSMLLKDTLTYIQFLEKIMEKHHDNN